MASEHVTEDEEIMRGILIADKYDLRLACDWDGIVALWRKGNDTLEIASVTGKCEAAVYNYLSALKPW